MGFIFCLLFAVLSKSSCKGSLTFFSCVSYMYYLRWEWLELNNPGNLQVSTFFMCSLPNLHRAEFVILPHYQLSLIKIGSPDSRTGTDKYLIESSFFALTDVSYFIRIHIDFSKNQGTEICSHTY